MASRLHLYNVPVSLVAPEGVSASVAAAAGQAPLSKLRVASSSNSSTIVSATPPVSNPLEVLRTVTKPEDFVVLKVDIDGGPELELVQRIAADPELYTRVDELYFEYHFYFDGLNFGWQTHHGGANEKRWNHTVDDALRLLRRLREHGIRAHFWI